MLRPILNVLFYIAIFMSMATSGSAAVIKIAPMGDSIVVGMNNNGGTPPPSWREPLWGKMQAAGWQVDFVGHTRSNHQATFDQDHSAKLGACIGDLLSFISLWQDKPDVALIYVGANHIIPTGCQPSAPAGAATEVGKVIDKLRTVNQNMIIFLAQIYPITADGIFPLSGFQSYNAFLATLTQQKSTQASPVIIVDQFTGFNESSDLVSDKVHPNTQGENKIAQKWFDAMKSSQYIQNIISPPSTSGNMVGGTIVTSTVGNGSIALDPPGTFIHTASGYNTFLYQLNADTLINITATPSPGYYFNGWTGNSVCVSGNNPNIIFKVPQFSPGGSFDLQCKATFIQNPSPSTSTASTNAGSIASTTTNCTSCCTANISENFDIHIPSAKLELLPNLNMWVNLKFEPNSTDGKMRWVLDNYGTQCNSCQPSTPPTSTVACGGLVQAGSDNPETHIVNLARNAGQFVFEYETYNVEDQIILEYEGRTLHDSGCVGTNGTRQISLSYQGSTSSITVRVIPNCTGTSSTQWNFKVNCPQ